MLRSGPTWEVESTLVAQMLARMNSPAQWKAKEATHLASVSKIELFSRHYLEFVIAGWALISGFSIVLVEWLSDRSRGASHLLAMGFGRWVLAVNLTATRRDCDLAGLQCS